MHLLLAILATFIAISAIPGGIVLLVGLEDFPSTWLQGTPFSDFTMPAWLLTGLVGGTALLAAVLGFARHRWAGWAAVVAGLTLMGYIGGELILLNDGVLWPHWIEWLYLAVGLVLGAVGGAGVRLGTVRWEVVYEARSENVYEAPE